MNFDFSPAETEGLIRLKETLAAFVKGRDLENRDIASLAATLYAGAEALAQTDYLKTGIVNDPPSTGGPYMLGLMETVAEVSPSFCLSLEMSTRLYGRLIARFADSVLKDRIFLDLTAGKHIGAVALSESAMNIDNAPFTTRMGKDGAEMVISGKKKYVVNASIADGILVGGLLNEEPALVWIPAKHSGLTVGDPISTMGYQGCAISEITLKDCRVPASYVLQSPANTNLLACLRMWENQILVGIGLGLMQGAYAAANAHAKTHQTGGKPIIAYQEVAFKLAESLTLYQTSRLLAFRAAWSEVNDPKEAEILTYCAKVFCTEAAEKVAGESLRILADIGFTAGNPAEIAYRCAKYGQIAGTSTEIARVKIGDAALK